MDNGRKLFDDVARVAGGAFETLAGVREEIEGLIRHRIDRVLAGRNLVTRDEFEAVREIAVAARADADRLETRVAELEAGISERADAGKKPASRTRRKPRRTAGKT